MSLDVDYLGFFLIIPIVILFSLIPISIAGWGVRESIMVVGFGYLSVPAEQALALSILYGFLMIIVALPGGFFWGFKKFL
jgi:uncharacterized membrane protein YbhN (UPF0104 family)